MRRILITAILFIGCAQALADDEEDMTTALAKYVKEIVSSPFLRDQSNQNVLDIQANGTAIGTNTTARGANAQAISANGTAIGANTTAHGTNAQAIIDNATDISSKADAQAVSDSLSLKLDSSELAGHLEKDDLSAYATSKDLKALAKGDVRDNADDIGDNITDISRWDARMVEVEKNVGIYPGGRKASTKDLQGRWAMQSRSRDGDKMTCYFMFTEDGWLVLNYKSKCVLDEVSPDPTESKHYYNTWDLDPNTHDYAREIERLEIGDDYEVGDVNYSKEWRFAYIDHNNNRWPIIVHHEFISRDMNRSHGTLEYKDGDQGQFTMVRYQ